MNIEWRFGPWNQPRLCLWRKPFRLYVETVFFYFSIATYRYLSQRRERK